MYILKFLTYLNKISTIDDLIHRYLNIYECIYIYAYICAMYVCIFGRIKKKNFLVYIWALNGYNLPAFLNNTGFYGHHFFTKPFKIARFF